ncbi:MAG: RHS repeat-associated core domain-containing protein [Bacteroidota bacterium]
MKTFCRAILLLCLYAYFPFSTHAQQTDDGFSPDAGLLPASPEAATLMKFEDVPVSLYTGTASIQIPITSQSDRDVGINISLSYHSGGAYVSEASNWVGLSWKLNAGGSITRRVRGQADDLNAPGIDNFLKFRNNHTPADIESWITQEDEYQATVMASECYDTQPDEFYFSVEGLNGKFAFDWTPGSGPVVSADVPVTVNYFQDDPSSQEISRFEIIGPDGKIYMFDQHERTVTDAQTDINSICTSAAKNFITSWYLSSIQSPQTNDNRILFEYEDYTIKPQWTSFESRNFGLFTNTLPCFVTYPIADDPIFSYQPGATILGKRLKKVLSSNGKFSIDFIANTPIVEPENYVVSTNFKSLDEIIIRGSNAAQFLHKFQFSYDNTRSRLLLTSVQQVGNQGTTLPPYRMQYNSTDLPKTTAYSVDHWGFYNGKSNSSLLPEYIHEVQPGNYVLYEGGDRSPDLTNTKAMSLEKITYPTGGYTEMDYELNTYGFVSDKSLGELDQLNINVLDGDAEIMGENSGYSVDEETIIISSNISGLMRIFLEASVHSDIAGQALPEAYIKDANGNTVYLWIPEHATLPNIPYTQIPPTYLLSIGAGTYTVGCRASGAFGPDKIKIRVEWSEVENNPLLSKFTGGLRVKETRMYDGLGNPPITKSYDYSWGNNSAASSGVIYHEPIYHYLGKGIGAALSVCDYISLVGASKTVLGKTGESHVGYRKVEVTHGANGENSSETSYFSSHFDHPDELNKVKPFAAPKSFSYKTGLLQQQEVRDASGSIVQSLFNTYQFVEKSVRTYKVGFGLFKPVIDPLYTLVPFSEKFAWWMSDQQMGISQLVQTTQVRDGVSTSTAYTFSPTHLGLTQTQISNSDGKIHKTLIDYPQDLGEIALIDKHILNIPLRTRQYVNNVLTGGQKTQFSTFPGEDANGNSISLILPYKSFQILNDGTELERATMLTYDPHGNLTSFTREPFNLYDPVTLTWEEDLLSSRTFLGWVETWTHDDNTRLLTSSTDVNDIESTYGYDDLQRLTTTTERDGALTYGYDYEYNLADDPNAKNKIIISSSADNLTTHEYIDGLGRSMQSVDYQYSPHHRDVVRSHTYDDFGRLIHFYQPFEGAIDGSYQPPQGIKDIITYEASPLNRELSQFFPDGSSISQTYGTNGTNDVKKFNPDGTENGFYSGGELFKSRVKDENGHFTETYEDKIGHVILVRKFIDGENVDTYNVYDDRNNLVKVYPPEGTAYSYNYDNRNRLSSKDVPGAGTTFFGYNDKDELTSMIDANGNQQIFTYDGHGRLRQTLLNGNLITDNTYDNAPGASLGLLASSQVSILNGGTITTSFVYDDMSRLIETNGNNHIGGGEKITTLYEGGTDRAVKMTREHSGYQSLTIIDDYVYDHSKRLTDMFHQIGNASVHLSHMTYDVKDQLIEKDLQDGLQSLDYQYNVRGWMTHLNRLRSANSRGDCADLPEVDPASCGEQTVELAELLRLRLGNEDLNVDCYQPCVPNPNCGTYATSWAPKGIGYSTIMANFDGSLPYQDLTLIHIPTNSFIDDGIEWKLNKQFIQLGEAAWNISKNDLNGDEVITQFVAKVEVTGAANILGEGYYKFGLWDGTKFIFINGGQLFVTGSQPGLIALQADQITVQQLENLQLVFFLNGTSKIDAVTMELDYEIPCCPGPLNCSETEQVLQLQSLPKVYEQMANTQGISFPTNLNRVRLCDGSILYLLDQELPFLAGNYAIEQTIGVGSWSQTFTVDAGGADRFDVFAMRLYYNEGTGDPNVDDGNGSTYSPILLGSPQYNGNVANLFWQTRGREQQYYALAYDELDRLTSAKHYESANGYQFNPADRYSVEGITYDKRGNILSLDRRGLIEPCGTPNAPTYGSIDALSYTYGTDNQLLRVDDATSLSQGFEDNANAPVEYQYDANGNMELDANKGIEVSYNFLNLPAHIEFANGNEIELTYDAAGNKLSKLSISANGQAVRKDYVGGIEYVTVGGTSTLEALYHAEGRAVPVFDINDGTTITDFTYEYSIRDHLGNSRVMISDINQDGELTIGGPNSELLQEQHYYPFGMSMEGNWIPQMGVENAYTYNGKELNNDFGLDWIDYGARWYDPSIGRWGQVDPLAEGYRPYSQYNYTLNNPIKFIDPDGRYVSRSEDFDKFEYEKNKAKADVIMREFRASLSQAKYSSTDNASNLDFCPPCIIFGGGAILEALGLITVGTVTTIAIVEITDNSLDDTDDIPYDGGYDDDDDEGDDFITLYRGVGTDKPAMHKLAMMGTAIPLGIEGGHSDPERHNLGDNFSIFTSWTTDEATAIIFGSTAGPGGVLLRKTFKLSETVPSPDHLDEDEVLIPGIVRNASATILY